jgi:hypothetical protein
MVKSFSSSYKAGLGDRIVIDWLAGPAETERGLDGCDK